MAGAQLDATTWITEYITPNDVYAHGVDRVLAAARTEFQDMLVVEGGPYGRALVLDGKWQSCTGDEFLYHEPLVQPACVIRAAAGAPPKTVLVLGGAEGATVREALRWKSVERVTMVDIDGPVVDACREHLELMHCGAFEDARTDLVIGDALKYIEPADHHPDAGWDVIVSDLSDPIEDGPSFPLFTKEQYQKMSDRLAPGGVLVVQSGPIAPIDTSLHAKLVSTLRAVFPHTASVLMLPCTYGSPWSAILASHEPLDAHVGSPVDAAKVDAILADHVAPFGGTELRMFDGRAMRGMMDMPKHVRDAIDATDEVFTMAAPPKFFGQGVAGGA